MDSAASNRKKTITILIAEDSVTQAEQLRYILEQHNYRVLAASNGKEAFSLLSEARPDIIISDIVMPELDGYGLCRRIKQDEGLRQIPVILLTALSDPIDVLKGLECGADNFVTKPYEEKYLRSRIEYLLANSRLREETRIQVGVEIIFQGQKYFITSERQQILNLLLSTYETAIEKNRELTRVQDELKALNEQLEEIIEQRTSALRAEIAERRRADEEVRTQREFLEKIIESLTHPFYVINAADYTLAMANSAARSGFSRGPDTCYALTHNRQEPCGRSGHPCPLERVRQTKEPVTMEHVHYDAVGSEKVVEIHGYPVLNSGGEVIQMIEYSFDITERKRAEEERTARIEELERFRNATIEREFRTKELKDRVKELEQELEQMRRSGGAS